MVYNRFGPRGKAIVDMFTFIFFFIFCYVLIWKSWPTALESFLTMERSASAFAPILFPFRMVIPVGVGLLLLQGIAKFMRDILVLSGRGKP